MGNTASEEFEPLPGVVNQRSLVLKQIKDSNLKLRHIDTIQPPPPKLVRQAGIHKKRRK